MPLAPVTVTRYTLSESAVTDAMPAPAVAVPDSWKSATSTPLTASLKATVKSRLPPWVGVAEARVMAAMAGAVVSTTKLSLAPAARALPELSWMLPGASVRT